MARDRAGMNVWLDWLGAVLNLDQNNIVLCSFPKTGQKMLLTGPSTEVQTSHNEFAVRDGEVPVYFSIFTGAVSAPHYVTPGSHVYVHYSGARNKLLTEAFVMMEVEILPVCVFVRQGYVQPAGSDWQEEHCIWYHSYSVPKNTNLLDAVDFSHGDKTALE